MKKRILVMLMAAAMMLSMAACGNGAEEKKTENSAGTEAQAADGESTLVYGSNDYTRINPAMDEHGEINILIFSGLTSHDGENQVAPGLAKSWDYDEDTLTYTFHLEENVKWHDGEPFTADDVKFTIEAIMDPDNGSENAPNYEDVTAIDVIDDHTIAFTLSAPNVAFDNGNSAKAFTGRRRYAGVGFLPPSDWYRSIQIRQLGCGTGDHIGKERGLFQGYTKYRQDHF